MLTISQKRFIRWAGLVCGNQYQKGGQNGHLSPLEIGIKNQILLEKPEVGISLMSPSLSAEAGCESRKRIVLLLVFIA